MSVALLFPGQGSQSVGMLAGLAASHKVVGETFAAASRVLGYDLWKLVSSGPPEQLNATACTQPAMLAAGFATWCVWQERGGAQPEFLSGHSLGEYTALVCAGAIDFEAAVDLVRVRGELMQAAVPAGSGAMAAILGMDDAEAEAVCAQAGEGEVVEAVNFNSPAQVVIAGHTGAVARAIAIAKTRGAKRAVLLPVSVPSHSSLMRGAAEALRARLATVIVRKPEVTFISAVDAEAHSEPDDIRATLVRQLASPVRWSATVQALVQRGATHLIECGPGKVLTGLNRRIERRPDIRCLALEDDATVQVALDQTVEATHA